MMVHLTIAARKWIILKEIHVMRMSNFEPVRSRPTCTEEKRFTAFMSGYLSDSIVLVGASIKSFNTTMLKLSLKIHEGM
jgi:hypothetical protein